MKCVVIAFCGFSLVAHAGELVRINPVNPRQVKVTQGFWHDRIETNRIVTLKTCFDKCEKTSRIANFSNAARRAWGTFKGIPFNDSDVFKVMEGAAYVLGQHPDSTLESYMDSLIAQVAGAQETDGYLYTARTLGFAYAQKGDLPWHFGMMGPTRWSNLSSSHEFYNVGHMYEAAVAWAEATGKTNFLAVAEKNFNLLNRTFGPAPDQLKDTSGHEEIELALCRLYRLTGERKYLDFCRFLLEMRGRTDLRANAGQADRQDHLPVLEQTEAIGHAVRAGYLYSGMADYAFATGDIAYIKAITRIWDDVVTSKLALHGGIGARREYVHPKYGKLFEAFNEPYGIPNDADASYYETCAAIANALWNERLFRATGEAKYMDVLERTIYNGFASGVSLSGDEFFYPNPLAAKKGCKRQKWFGCSCCPVNIVRFIPQIPGFAFATKGNTLYWNLFLNGTADISGCKLAVTTDYPWSGAISLKVLSLPKSNLSGTLKIRIPGWACGRPVPSDLYAQTEPSSFFDVLVEVNGLALNSCPGEDGYLAVSRTWKVGDVVTLNLPMPVKRIRASDKVAADHGRMAVERGPIVYCAEGVDNAEKAYGAVLPVDATFEGMNVVIGGKKYPALKSSTGLVLIPYALWDNRKPGNEMQAWFSSNRPSAPVEFRGVVEGYYGRPWGTEGRLSLLDFMGENDMNVFIYGPKDDPYHHSKWRELYPAVEMADFKKLLACAKKNKVNFYWAIHLGGSFKRNCEADYTALFKKLDSMYDIGFRSFAVFFDDFGGADAAFHAEICNRVVADFLERKGDCSSLIMCPNVYWGSGHPYQKTLGDCLDQRVHVMWTGRGICSDITEDAVARITADLKRPPFVWWNWPVNDYCRRKLLLGRTYGIANCKYAGFVTNPMENCEANKLALYGVAKWAKDPATFDSQKTWEESFAKIYPDSEIAKAMRVFAEHNSDQGPTVHGFRREESVSAVALCEKATQEFDSTGQLTHTTAVELRKLFKEVGSASQMLLKKLPRDKGLGWEIEGWLENERYLMAVGVLALDLLTATDENRSHDLLLSILEMREKSDEAAQAHMAKFREATFPNDKGHIKKPEASTTVLKPLIEKLLEGRLRKLYAEQHKGAFFDAVGSFAGFSTAKAIRNPHVSLTQNKYAGYERILEPRAVAPGEIFGLSVPKSWQTDYFHAKLGEPAAVEAGVIEVSKDAKDWKRLDVRIHGAEMETPLKVQDGWRHVRYRNASNKSVTVKLSLFKFDVRGATSPIDEMLRALVPDTCPTPL